MTQAMIPAQSAPATPATLASAGERGSAYTRDQVELIKRTIAKGATDDELQLFVATAKRLRLDPFARQIFAIKRYDTETKSEGLTTHVSIDGLRLIAERTGEYLPSPDLPRFTYNEKGQLQACEVYVLKWRRDAWHRVPAFAFFDEYAQMKRDGQLTKNWREKQHLMLAKCAESAAIRKAFPHETSGVSVAEEDDEPEVKPTAEMSAPPKAPPRPEPMKATPAPARSTTPAPARREGQGDPVPSEADLDRAFGPSPAKAEEHVHPLTGEVTPRPPTDAENRMIELQETFLARFEAAATNPEIEKVAADVSAAKKAGKLDTAFLRTLGEAMNAAYNRIAGRA